MVSLALSCVCASAAENSASAQEAPAARIMKIRTKLPDSTLTATLADNAASRDFVSLLPLAVTLKDCAAPEKISDLPGRLSSAGAPAGCDPRVGDATYYAPWAPVPGRAYIDELLPDVQCALFS